MASGKHSADVVVVGGGIVGLSTAYQTARRSKSRVVVLEKGLGVGEGSTGASSAVLRHRYSLDEMVALARDGVRAYREWPAFTGISRPRAEFQDVGVLWIPGDDGTWAEQEARRMATFDIPAAVLDDAELAERFPALNPCRYAPDVETGIDHECAGGSKHFLETSGGWIDPVAAAQDLVEAGRREGVDVRFGKRVSALHRDGGRVTGVELDDGMHIAAPVVLNAAGPWCNTLFDMLGIYPSWTLTPTRIQVLYLDRPRELVGDIPVTVDMVGGVYFRTQSRGQQLVVGSTRESDEKEGVVDPDAFDRLVDEDFSRSRLHAMHHRLPGLPYRGPVRGYSGLYTVNQQDVHPIVGSTPVEGFFVANGFSGHGFKLAPAIGSLLAQALTGTQADYDTDVPAEFLAFDREPLTLEDKSVLA